MKKKIVLSILLGTALVVGIVFALAGEGIPTLAEGVGLVETEIWLDCNPGGNNTAVLTVINGKDSDKLFSITLAQPNPDSLQAGYEPFPEEHYGWFTLPGELISVPAGGYFRVSIPISVPADTDFLDRPAELRVQAIAFNPDGIVQIGVASKWYIVVTEP